MAVAILLLLVLLAPLSACGGGDPIPEDCEISFVGPVQPGQLPPTCEVAP